MLVEFINNSKSKSRIIVQRILNNYAKRVSDNVWHCNITMQGLEVIQQVLKRNATKQTCILCFKANKLLWCVGNPRLNIFTSMEEQVNNTQDTFLYFDVCKNILTVVSALHDIGKKNDGFQYKIQHHLKVDKIRHEFISCKIIECLYDIYSDNWFEVLVQGKINSDKVNAWMNTTDKYRINYANMSILCQSLCYFILSHHKLPYNENVEWNTCFDTITDMLQKCQCYSGYFNECDEDVNKYYHFTCEINLSEELRTILSHVHIQSIVWEQIVQDVSIFHYLVYLIRANLMLGDYCYSAISIRHSNEAKQCWANTNSIDNSFNQTVDEHLHGVAVKSVAIYQQNAHILCHLNTVKNDKLKHKSIAKFKWQDKICEKLQSFDTANNAFFICNMASTGSGKTKANAKIMHALNSDMRFTVALGLRQLVKQTADNYVEDYIGFQHSDVGMNIGDDSFIQLQHVNKETNEDLIDKLNGFEEEYNLDFDFTHLKSIIYDKKTLSFISKPILVTTIDYLMRATQCLRGKKYILPFLRLCSSDIVIDEIDDFSLTDIQAILHLVYMVGMNGKNIIISSATMPTDVAIACQHAFNAGLQAYNHCHAVQKTIQMIICDEFASKICDADYATCHNHFVNNRIRKLIKNVKHHGKIFDIHHNSITEDVKNEMVCLHNINYAVDTVSNKKVSFGCIRVSHVDECVALAKQLTRISDNDVQIAVLCYHSRFPLILRVDREQYLSHVLNRKKVEAIFHDESVRKYIDNAIADNIIFVLVTTAIEEVGKDHDFDWVIMELSSIHSLCQMKGRVRRHRDEVNNINVSIMNYPIDFFRKPKLKYYIFPGVESHANVQMKSHTSAVVLSDIDINNITEKYCIQKPSKFKYINDEGMYWFESMYMAEQFVYTQLFADINRYTNEYIYMTAYPQIHSEFRKRTLLTDDVYVQYDNVYKLYQWNSLILQNVEFNKTVHVDNDFDVNNIWYHKSLVASMHNYPLQYDKYCTVNLLHKNKTLYYNDNFGFFYKLS